MKEIIKKLIPQRYHEKLAKFQGIFNGYAMKSFSQEGEDMILRRIFERQEVGFYIDVGAHHPRRFSNTYIFYKLGWRGINIEPMPGSIKLFNRVRSKDINLEYAVSETEGELTCYIFKNPAFNTFSKELADQNIRNGRLLLREEKIMVYPLSKILDQYMKTGQKIDFMSIDVEGWELPVLRSNDWDKYKATILLVESLNFDLSDLHSSELYRYLASLNYGIIAKTKNTVFFKHKGLKQDES